MITIVSKEGTEFSFNKENLITQSKYFKKAYKLQESENVLKIDTFTLDRFGDNSFKLLHHYVEKNDYDEITEEFELLMDYLQHHKNDFLFNYCKEIKPLLPAIKLLSGYGMQLSIINGIEDFQNTSYASFMRNESIDFWYEKTKDYCYNQGETDMHTKIVDKTLRFIWKETKYYNTIDKVIFDRLDIDNNPSDEKLRGVFLTISRNLLKIREKLSDDESQNLINNLLKELEKSSNKL